MTRRIDIIGGGPAGLYAARLLKLARPSLEVTVYERLAGDADTFGFGVGLTESTMRNLAQADQQTGDQIREASYAGHALELYHRDESVALHGARNLAIGRARLLRILADGARDVGVDIRTGVRADVATTYGADVVIAADGVRSATRRKLGADLGVHDAIGRSRFVWCGADFAVDAAFFSSTETADGLFVAHAYPYDIDRSTFLIEVDEQTWISAGLAELDAAAPPDATDEASVELLNGVFADVLGGRKLLTNRTRWSRFTTLSLDRWSSGNSVLLGDAAHTAHYTLGSGTKLALEDAIALADALVGEESIAAAFATYEEVRRPPVQRFKRLAGRSQAWWDSYRSRADRPVEELALSYMTRAGNLGIQDYAVEHLSQARDALAWLGEVPSSPEALDDWVLSRPFPGLGIHARDMDAAVLGTIAHRLIEWNEPDVWGESADHVIRRLMLDGDTPVLVSGGVGAESIGARIDMAERIRLETECVVGVRLPAVARAQAAAAIGARRADFVVRD